MMYDYDSADTTEFISPWIAPPTTGVTILDPDHTVYAQLEDTQVTRAPRKRRGLFSKFILVMFVFDVALAGYAGLALTRVEKSHPAVVVGTTRASSFGAASQGSSTTIPEVITTTTMITVTTVPVVTTAPTTAATTQAPKTTAACAP